MITFENTFGVPCFQKVGGSREVEGFSASRILYHSESCWPKRVKRRAWVGVCGGGGAVS